MTYASIPKHHSYEWNKVLPSVPSGKALYIDYDSRHSAMLAGESARSFARYNKADYPGVKLHTSINGKTLTLWFE